MGSCRQVAQWGMSSPSRGGTVTYPISFPSAVYTVVVGFRADNSSGGTGSQSLAYVYNATTTSFVSGSYDTGRGYQGVNWCAVGK